ncbi:MAG: hypothetical protein M0Z98_09590 [Actinomycetales bacterium]|nr:hypothetical protein [Actinomycetales bacterium]
MTTSVPVSVLWFLVGLAVVLGVGSSILRTLVVPRGVRSKLSAGVLTATLTAFRAVARRTSTYEARDAVLAYAAPVSLIVMLMTWLALLFVGFACLLFAFSPLDWAASFREAGSSLFTLGFASTDRTQLTAVDFLAAATGPVVVGLLVGYLPSLYASYNRREVEVALLHSRAGEPNWGPEILSRHAIVNSSEELVTLFRGWERWAADIAESHVNYPVLIHVRSAQPLRNWLVALVSVMDAAAFQLATNPQLPQASARVALRQGFVAVRDIARAEGLDVDDDPSPDAPISLTFEEFAEAYDDVAAAGYAMARSAVDAWPHFRGWRVNYEAAAYALAERIDAPPAAWTGTRRPPLPVIMPHRPANRMPGGRTGRPAVGE